MASVRRRPRGLNFLLGGLAVAAAVILYALFAGPIDLGGFGAPKVRIDDAPAAAAAAATR